MPKGTRWCVVPPKLPSVWAAQAAASVLNVTLNPIFGSWVLGAGPGLHAEPSSRLWLRSSFFRCSEFGRHHVVVPNQFRIATAYTGCPAAGLFICEIEFLDRSSSANRAATWTGQSCDRWDGCLKDSNATNCLETPHEKPTKRTPCIPSGFDSRFLARPSPNTPNVGDCGRTGKSLGTSKNSDWQSNASPDTGAEPNGYCSNWAQLNFEMLDSLDRGHGSKAVAKREGL